MKLQDLNCEQNIIVQIVWGEQKIEFTSNMVEGDPNGIYIQPYLHNDKPLELNITPDSDVICNIFGDDLENRCRVSWRNIDLSTVNRNGETLYYVKTYLYNSVAKGDERRAHNRVLIKNAGVAVDEEGKEIPVIIRDISNNGFAIFASPAFRPATTKIKLKITDQIKDQSFIFYIEGRIVHVQNDSGFVQYGCEVDNPTKEFLLYGCIKHILEKNQANKNGMDMTEKNNTEEKTNVQENAPS